MADEWLRSFAASNARGGGLVGANFVSFLPIFFPHWQERVNYIRGERGSEVQNRIATDMVPSSGCGPSFFSGFRNLIFFRFPARFQKKMEGKDPLDPLL